MCRGICQTARLLTYFFGDEHLKEFNTQEVEFSTSTCQNMLWDKRTPNGPLTLMLGKNGIIGPTTPWRRETMWVHTAPSQKSLHPYDKHLRLETRKLCWRGRYERRFFRKPYPRLPNQLTWKNLQQMNLVDTHPQLDSNDGLKLWDASEDDLPDALMHSFDPGNVFNLYWIVKQQF